MLLFFASLPAGRPIVCGRFPNMFNSSHVQFDLRRALPLLIAVLILAGSAFASKEKQRFSAGSKAYFSRTPSAAAVRDSTFSAASSAIPPGADK